MHDEVGAHFDSSFIEMVAATLRGPAGYPEPGKASRFWSEDLGKNTIVASFTVGSNQHLDLDQYIRNIKVAVADDPALLDAWLFDLPTMNNLQQFISPVCFAQAGGLDWC